MIITIKESELKDIILDHLKKRGIEIDLDSIGFEYYEPYEGYCALYDEKDVRVVAMIKEEAK